MLKNKLAVLLRAKRPLIAVPFSDNVTTPEIAAARAQDMDIAELRIDRFIKKDTRHALQTAALFKNIPVIATIRSSAEGGEWHGSEKERLALFQKLASIVDALDIELSSQKILSGAIKAAHKNNALAIVSFHDFAGTPPGGNLADIIKKAKVAGADIIKIATMVHTQEDVRVLTRLLLDHPDEKLIIIGMGSLGAITRLAFPALGSLITFAAGREVTAPGQMGLHELVSVFRLLKPTPPSPR